jgi:hypothetical protein
MSVRPVRNVPREGLDSTDRTNCYGLRRWWWMQSPDHVTPPAEFQRTITAVAFAVFAVSALHLSGYAVAAALMSFIDSAFDETAINLWRVSVPIAR